MADTIETAEQGKKTAPVIPWRGAILVAGDAVSFLVFAGVGRQQHGEISGLGALAEIAVTAAPFALGWFLVSPWVGTYRQRLTATVRSMLGRTELAWLASFPVALALRLLLVHDNLRPDQIATFALVILCANALFLGIWRSVFAAIEGWLSRARG
jgi:hypothetical protein